MITRFAIIGAASILLWTVLAAEASVFTFNQTGASVPSLSVTAEISLAGNDTLADLPTISSCLGCTPNFSPLTDLSLAWIAPHGGASFPLLDFTEPTNLGFPFPQWDISPSRIDFINAHDDLDFFISGPDGPISRIQVDEDGQFGSPCAQTGACIATGNWIAVGVPEGSSLMMLTSALLGFCMVRAMARSKSVNPGSCRPHLTG